MCILSPRKKWEKEWEKTVFEKMLANNFPKLTKVGKSQVWEAMQTASNINTKRNIPRYIAVKQLKIKDKEKSLKYIELYDMKPII